MSTPRLEAPPPQTLRDYALIADGERGALIGGTRGHLLDVRPALGFRCGLLLPLIGGRGHYTIRPRGRFVWGGYYEGGALIWRSRWVTQEGIVECREAMAFPGDPHRAVLLRRIIAVQGPAHVTAALAPYAGFGAEPPERLRHEEDGTWTGNSAALRWRWRGADRACPRPGPSAPEGLDLRLDLRAGEQHDLVLELSDAPLPSPEEPSALWSATEESWKRAEPRLAPSLAPEDARHAYTLLRGMTSRTGGMVGAATTSLPERAEEGRNYDYRYVWIRDQSFAGQAAAVADGDPLLDAAVDFISARLHQDGPRMAPAYTLTGGRIPDQRTLGLPGYPGGFDRVGNWVTRQFQLDAFGEALLLFAAAHRARAAWTGTDGARPRSPSTPSAGGDTSRTPVSGNCRHGTGPTAASSVWPGCVPWPQLPPPPSMSGPGAPSPTPCSPRPPRPVSTPAGVGNGHRMIPGWTQLCCYRRCAAACRPTTHGCAAP